MPNEDYVDAAPDGTTANTPDNGVAADVTPALDKVDGQPAPDASQTTLDAADAGDKGKPDYQKMFLDTKRELTKRAMENAELRGKLSGVQEATRPQPKAEVDWLEEVDWEAVKADPTLVKELIQKNRNEIVGVLQARDALFEQRLQTINPDVVAHRDKIAELKLDPEYAGFSDIQLAVIARKMPTKEGEPAPGKPQGSIGGGSRPAQKPEDIRKSPLYLQIYGEGSK